MVDFFPSSPWVFTSKSAHSPWASVAASSQTLPMVDGGWGVLQDPNTIWIGHHLARGPLVASALLVAASMTFDFHLDYRTKLESMALANFDNKAEQDDEDDTTDVINWSGTHKVNVKNENFWEPESVEEVESIIR